MGVVLALLSAVCYGSSDFTAGVGGRRSDPAAITAVAQPFGLIAAAVAVLTGRSPAPHALWWGALSGGSSSSCFSRSTIRIAAASNKSARKRAIARVVQEVADYLGNTSAVARASYIDPRIIDLYQDGRTIASVLGELGKDRDFGDLATRGRAEKAVTGREQVAGQEEQLGVRAGDGASARSLTGSLTPRSVSLRADRARSVPPGPIQACRTSHTAAARTSVSSQTLFLI